MPFARLCGCSIGEAREAVAPALFTDHPALVHLTAPLGVVKIALESHQTYPRCFLWPYQCSMFSQMPRHTFGRPRRRWRFTNTTRPHRSVAMACNASPTSRSCLQSFRSQLVTLTSPPFIRLFAHEHTLFSCLILHTVLWISTSLCLLYAIMAVSSRRVL